MSAKRKYIRSGDSPSLWNYTLSPGWTREEASILRLALMKCGVGAWNTILNLGCLPGKTRAQLVMQSQRMIGQQSLAEFMGIRLAPDVVFQDNEKRTDAKRKNGYIVNAGNNPTKEETQKKIQLNREKYEIPQEESDAIVLPRKTFDKKVARLNALKERLKVLEKKLAEKTGTAPPAAAEAVPAQEEVKQAMEITKPAAEENVEMGSGGDDSDFEPEHKTKTKRAVKRGGE